MNNSLCCGCLCIDRKLRFIDDFWKKQNFLQILSEIPLTLPEGSSLWMCWECAALLSRFTKFKRQVKHSYKVLNEYARENKKLSQIQPASKLHIHNFPPIDISPPEQAEGVDDIKQEEDDKCEIEIAKIEDDNVSLGSVHYEEELAEETEAKVRKRGRPKKNLDDNNGISNKKKAKRKEECTEEYKTVILSKEEIIQERKELSRSSVFENSNIKCVRCIIAFANIDDYNDHEANKHDSNETYRCDICECTFSNEVSYNYHNKKHRIRYQCMVCTERLASKRAADKHYAYYHGTGLSNFDNFDSIKESNGDDEHTYSQEADYNSSNETFPCDYCDKVFKWKTSLNKHAEMHRIQAGQKRKPYCEPCRLTFTTTSNLQKHVKTSSKHQIQLKLRKLKESLPDTENTDKRQIDKIKNDINSSLNKFPCPHCDKKFQWKGNLLRHVQSHVARSSGSLVCTPCGRSFSSIATYTQHMKISKKHVTEHDFKYMCSDCGKKFPNKTLLKDHVDWEHLKNYVHKCSICQKVFKSHTSLYLHNKVAHKRDNGDHLCDHCGKPFPNHAKLRTHIIAMHTSEQPYKCKLCTATFSWHSCLSRHVKVVHHKIKLKRKKTGKIDME